jgi:ribosomal protein L29
MDGVRREFQIARLEDKLKDFRQQLVNLSFADKTPRTFAKIETYKTEIAEIETWLEELEDQTPKEGNR